MCMYSESLLNCGYVFLKSCKCITYSLVKIQCSQKEFVAMFVPYIVKWRRTIFDCKLIKEKTNGMLTTDAVYH